MGKKCELTNVEVIKGHLETSGGFYKKVTIVTKLQVQLLNDDTNYKAYKVCAFRRVTKLGLNNLFTSRLLQLNCALARTKE